MSNLLESSKALVSWLRDIGNTGKPRSSRVPRRLLEELEKAIGETEQAGAVDLAEVPEIFNLKPNIVAHGHIVFDDTPNR